MHTQFLVSRDEIDEEYQRRQKQKKGGKADTGNGPIRHDKTVMGSSLLRAK